MERVELPRLSQHDTEELALRILGREPAVGLTEALYRRSEGNPLFVETLLCCDGELSPELPESLRDLLLDGVRRLPEDTQEVLRVASAGGAATGHALLADVTGLDDGALIRALRPAVTANVLHPQGDGYAFRHELIREAVHDDLLPGEHGRLHSRFAEAIDADPGLVPPGRAAVEMAHHWHSRARLRLGADRRLAGRGAGGPGGGGRRAARRCWPASLNCGTRCRMRPSGSARITPASWRRRSRRRTTSATSNAGSRWRPRR